MPVHQKGSGQMAKRKSTDMAQVGLRLPEKLRKMIEADAKRNGWSLNRELTRRLEQSFAQQATIDAIKSAALAPSAVLIDQFNDVLEALGRPDLVIKRGDLLALIEMKTQEARSGARLVEAAEPEPPSEEVAKVSVDKS
jgi:hypothetical protein